MVEKVTKGQQNHQFYMGSNHWRKLSKKVKLKRKCCELCGSDKRLNVHHRLYRDKKGSIYYREQLEHLILLCHSCHDSWHSYHGFGYLSHSAQKKIVNLIFNGGCTPDYAIMTRRPENKKNKVNKPKTNPISNKPKVFIMACYRK